MYDTDLSEFVSDAATRPSCTDGIRFIYLFSLFYYYLIFFFFLLLFVAAATGRRPVGKQSEVRAARN
jgi:hypothetical protein